MQVIMGGALKTKKEYDLHITQILCVENHRKKVPATSSACEALQTAPYKLH